MYSCQIIIRLRVMVSIGPCSSSEQTHALSDHFIRCACIIHNHSLAINPIFVKLMVFSNSTTNYVHYNYH